MKKEIITDYHQLSVRAEELNAVKESELKREIVSSLKSVVREKNLNGLSATALGYFKRVFVLNFSDLEIKTFINPMIVHREGLQLSEEVCSSIENKRYLVPRSSTIDVMYTDPMGKIQSRKLIGKSAFQFQHEMDHLEGVLISDLGLEIDSDFDNASEEEKSEVISAYLDSIDLTLSKVEESINNNEELKKINDAINFMSSVEKGETQLEHIDEENMSDNTDNKTEED